MQRLLIFSLLILPVLASCSPQKKGAPLLIDKASPEEKKLTIEEAKLLALLTSAHLPFNDAYGDSAPLAQNILANKTEFLSDLQGVLRADALLSAGGDSLLIRADKQVFLDSSYVPPDLVPLTKESAAAGGYTLNRTDLALRRPAEAGLSVMAQAAKANGITLLVSSTYRSYTYQKTVYERNVRQLGKEVADRESAAPGASQHQLGTAADFGSITDEFSETRAGKWLAANAESFGWSLSFPKDYEAITGYRWECWHFRYLGTDALEFQKKWFKNVQQHMIEFLHAWTN